MPNMVHPKTNQPKNQPSQKLEAACRLWGYFVDKIAQKLFVFLKRSSILTSLWQRDDMEKAREMYQEGV